MQRIQGLYCILTHNRITIMQDLTKKEKEKEKPKKYPIYDSEGTGRSPFTPGEKKKESTKSSLAQIAKCNLTMKSIHSGIQDTLRRRLSPHGVQL